MWFDVAAALAEIEGRPAATLATSATRRAESLPVSQMSRKSQGAGSENDDVIAPDLARDLFEERAAIREHEGGPSRAEAEALAVKDVARALGLPVDEVRRATMPEAPALDAEGLPSMPCPRCGGGEWWKPARLPFEGPGWQCDACSPPGEGERRHATSLPVARETAALIRALFEERAAIREHEGGMPRVRAEVAAMGDVAQVMRTG